MVPRQLVWAAGHLGRQDCHLWQWKCGKCSRFGGTKMWSFAHVVSLSGSWPLFKWQRPLFLSSPAGPQILDSSKSASLPPTKKNRISCPYGILAHYHKSWLSAVRLSSLVDWHQKYPPISLVTQVSTKAFIFFLASAPPSKSLVSHPLAGRGRFAVIYSVIGASLGAQMVKNLPAVQEAWVWSLGGEDALEKGMATHSSILAWRIPCRGAWRATVQGVAESRTQQVSDTFTLLHSSVLLDSLCGRIPGGQNQSLVAQSVNTLE